MERLHTDGRYIKDVQGRTVNLRGCDFLEPSYLSDHLQPNTGTLSSRAERLKELGVSYVRVEVNYEKWNSNEDTNGDGVGNRDFTIQAIKEFTSRGIYCIPGLHTRMPAIFYTTPSAWANWLINELVNTFHDNPGVCGIYLWNEPNYSQFGGANLGGGITSGYWESLKHVCDEIYAANPELLMVGHADMLNMRGLSRLLETDPIPTPNVVYTWHFYYNYCPAFNPYKPWMSGIEDPTYEDCKDRGQPYYQSYAAGHLAQAKTELETRLYNDFLWPLDLPSPVPIINDEFGFTGDEIPHFSARVCDTDPTNHRYDVNQLVDEQGNPASVPFGTTSTVVSPNDGLWYCPVDGSPIPQPQPYAEPGWPHCMHDFIEIMNKYGCHWASFAWWPKEGYNPGYGLCTRDMTTLSKMGEVWSEHLAPPIFPTLRARFPRVRSTLEPLAPNLFKRIDKIRSEGVKWLR